MANTKAGTKNKRTRTGRKVTEIDTTIKTTYNTA
jgi:hypothetical protein